MNFDKFASVKVAQNTNVLSISSQSEAIALEPNTAIQSSSEPVYSFFVWMIVLYAGSWVVLEFLHRLIAILMKTKISKLSRFSPFQSRCRKCQFFDENNYLNCAVHPSVVLTKKAANCPDYEV